MAEELKIEKSIPEKITENMIEKLTVTGHFSKALMEEIAKADLSKIESLKQLFQNQPASDENTETGN